MLVGSAGHGRAEGDVERSVAQALESSHFTKELINYTTSGPIVLMVLEGDGAIAKYREIMGATNPVESEIVG